jgi:hypothetical protein
MGGYKLGGLVLVDATLLKVHILTLTIFKIWNGNYVVINELHSSDIRNTNIFGRCSKRSIFKYF